MAERKKLLLRLDPQVYEAIAKWAADDLRSVNAQIEYALRLALRSVGRPPRPASTGSASGEPGQGDTGSPAGEPDHGVREPGHPGKPAGGRPPG